MVYKKNETSGPSDMHMSALMIACDKWSIWHDISKLLLQRTGQIF